MISGLLGDRYISVDIGCQKHLSFLYRDMKWRSL
ncbi:hypothetical protein MAQ5080_02695 [Marinomonas aquimarina]|uniref:Uncharacterized protein n=1 Tax=Marinomonas aquimarina TaxID=295068 RepID=A0A1A8TJY8_9GAMM|nr:hypothetical protein MAQ5080_02695 [Marinomonas aquimarina]